MASDPLVLAFDTSAAHCAAALLSGTRRLAALHEDMVKGQAERLMPMLDEALDTAGATFEDLAAIGVGIGPGNFTGTRIAVSTARGLALSLGIPAIGVTTLEAMAFGCDATALCTLDARREMFYAQVFGSVTASEPVYCSLDDLPRSAPGEQVCVIGHRADELAQRLGGTVRAPRYTPAEAIARLALDRFGAPGLPRPAPLYLRPADAALPSDPPPVILP